ncbi:hypothetical protein DKX38_020048 [Salix brachista]|uniref:non-specific serine/threonine protein kinase n=1 Tax=Salix brachista TaxID=2182728 RepID=A0A5N5KI18_9ROSI|nr:hypothetical protein DKX38_020048 [Salix brachista]
MNFQNLFVFLCLFFTITKAQTTIPPGTSLSASNPNLTWSSPKNSFYIGFSQVGSSSSYTLSINYNGGVPIWTAGNSTTTVDSEGSFGFLSSGNLRLLNGSGAIVWDSNTAGLGVTTASLDEFGNLVLKNGTLSVWMTFDHPSDTIVPNQTLRVDQALISGSYSFRFLRSGNLTLKWNNSIEYWNQGNASLNANLSSPTLGIQPTGILSIFDAAFTSGPQVVAYSNDYGVDTRMRFLKLDKDGNFRMYSADLGSKTPIMVWSALTDQCEVFGYCGNMGICSYNESSSSPICDCPSENFEPVDVNDSRQGCKRKAEIDSCPGNATMLEIDNAKFLTYEPELRAQIFYMGISACRSNCLSQGSACIASTSLSDGTGQCYSKPLGFISGYRNPALPSTSYVKVCGPAQPSPPPGVLTVENSRSRGLRVWVVCVAVVITLLGLIAVESGLWWWCCRNSPKFDSLSAQYALLEYASGAPVQFSYRELQRSTKEFKEKLGAGGFGAVYKGVLANREVVAVKQLEGIEQVSAVTNRKKFSVWAYEEFEKGNVNSILDQRLIDQGVDIEQVTRAIQVSFWCIQEHPSQRPMMGKVVQMLEGISEIERPPAPKAITESSVSGTSIMSSDVSALSTFAASAPAPSSSSSHQTGGVSPLASGPTSWE